MADDTVGADDVPITFNVKSSNDAKYTLTLPASTQVSSLKEKLATSEYADTPADRQRLIYSGRVLKDNETLSTYKIKDGHTIHLVKSAASNQRQGATSQSASTSSSAGATSNPSPASGVPTNLATGTGNNPLAGLTGARYAGFAQLPGAGMFGPDGGMGPPPNADQLAEMIENPNFLSQMNEALQNPAMIDMMISQNPMLRNIPGARRMFESPEFRRMMTDPNMLRQAMQAQQRMPPGIFGGLDGGAGGNAGSAFPAPGITNTTPQENRDGQNSSSTSNDNNTAAVAPGFNPFNPPGLGAGNPFAALFQGNPGLGANLFGAPNPAGGLNNTQGEGNQNPAGGSTASGEGQTPQANPNPFSLLNPALFGGQGGPGGYNPFDPQQNPILQNPALAQDLLQYLGGAGGAAGENGAAGQPSLASILGGLGGLGGVGNPTPPVQDSRPPEERYADQLRQLNDMGFYEFERNIEALRRTGGSVQGAVEYLLSFPS